MEIDEDIVKEWQALIPRLRAVLPTAKESSKRCASRQFWAVAEACKREKCRVSEILRPWRNLTYAMLRKSRKEHDRQEMRLEMTPSSSESGSEYSDDDRDVDLDRMNPYISDADAFLHKMFEEEKKRLGNAKATLDQCRQSIIERTREEHEREIRKNPQVAKNRDDSDEDELPTPKGIPKSSPLRGAMRKRQSSVISVESNNEAVVAKKSKPIASYNIAKDRVCERCAGPVSNKSRQYCRQCLIITQRESKVMRDAEKAKAAADPTYEITNKGDSRSPSFTDSGNSTAATPDLQDVMIIPPVATRTPTVTRSGRKVIEPGKYDRSIVLYQTPTTVSEIPRCTSCGGIRSKSAKSLCRGCFDNRRTLRLPLTDASGDHEELPDRNYPPPGARVVCDECAKNVVHYVQGMCKPCYDTYRSELINGKRVKKEREDIDDFVPLEADNSSTALVLYDPKAIKRSNRCRGPQCSAFLSRNAKTGLCRNCYIEYPEYRNSNVKVNQLALPSKSSGKSPSATTSQSAANTSAPELNFVRGKCVICGSDHKRPRAPTCSLKCHRMMKVRESKGLPIGQVAIKREEDVLTLTYDEPVNSNTRRSQRSGSQKNTPLALMPPQRSESQKNAPIALMPPPIRPKVEEVYVQNEEIPLDIAPPEMNEEEKEKFEELCRIRKKPAMCRMCFSFMDLNQRFICTGCTEEAVRKAQRHQAKESHNRKIRFLNAFLETTEQYMYVLEKKPQA